CPVPRRRARPTPPPERRPLPAPLPELRAFVSCGNLLEETGSAPSLTHNPTFTGGERTLGQLHAEDALGVGVIDLLENFPRQGDAVDVPASLNRRRRGDLLLRGLEPFPGGLEKALHVGGAGRIAPRRAEHQIFLGG